MTNHTDGLDAAGVAELLPCPFCGGEANRHANELSGLMTMVHCVNCGAEAFDKKWNRRSALVDAPAGEPVGYLFELCYSHDHDRWSGSMYSEHLPNPSDVRNVRPLFASPRPAVSEAMVEAACRWFDENFNGMPNTHELVRGVLTAALGSVPGKEDGNG